VLIVEDEAIWRRVCASTLQAEGHDVEVAGDGEDALLRLVTARNTSMPWFWM